MSNLILGIESSCDETAAAVVESGRREVASVVHSQIDEHAKWGGVVPEIASRSHLEQILPVLDRCLNEAQVELTDLAGIAVTNRPGLIGSLLVGVGAAKGLALATDLPLVGVDHIKAHVYAATMDLAHDPYPAIALVVSGGHTALYLAEGALSMTPLASTLDDAAGEAFDKVAHMLGLSYPGGPSVSKLALEGNPKAIAFPRYRPKRGGLGFSFSGLKTAVLYHLRGGDALAPTPAPRDIVERANVAASFQEAVVDALVKMTLKAAKEHNLTQVLVAGGVGCNQRLREVFAQASEPEGIHVHFPPPNRCTDNAVMIAGLGWQLFETGQVGDLNLDASPR
jgi:N6-L-threonylcarbamoyladenine synthase